MLWVCCARVVVEGRKLGEFGDCNFASSISRDVGAPAAFFSGDCVARTAARFLGGVLGDFVLRVTTTSVERTSFLSFFFAGMMEWGLMSPRAAVLSGPANDGRAPLFFFFFFWFIFSPLLFRSVPGSTRGAVRDTSGRGGGAFCQRSRERVGRGGGWRVAGGR